MVLEQGRARGIEGLDWPELAAPIAAQLRPVIAWRIAADGHFRFRPVLAGEWIVALGPLASRFRGASVYQPAQSAYLVLSNMDFRRLFEASTTHEVAPQERRADEECAAPTPLFGVGQEEGA